MTSPSAPTVTVSAPARSSWIRWRSRFVGTPPWTRRTPHRCGSSVVCCLESTWFLVIDLNLNIMSCIHMISYACILCDFFWSKGGTPNLRQEVCTLICLGRVRSSYSKVPKSVVPSTQPQNHVFQQVGTCIDKKHTPNKHMKTPWFKLISSHIQ